MTELIPEWHLPSLLCHFQMATKSITRCTSVFMCDQFLPGSMPPPHDWCSHFPFFGHMSLGSTDWPSHQPCSVLMILLPLPSPLRLEPLGSRCQLDLDQSCCRSENCEGVANYKPHFSWLPYLSQSSSHSAHSHVSKYPQRNFPKLTWSLPFSKSWV